MVALELAVRARVAAPVGVFVGLEVFDGVGDREGVKDEVSDKVVVGEGVRVLDGDWELEAPLAIR